MQENFPVYALLCDTRLTPDYHLSFNDYADVMTPRLHSTVAKYLQEPLDTINRLQHEAPQSSAVVGAYMDIFKSRQAHKEKLVRVFSIVKMSPTLYGVVCDLNEAIGDLVPRAQFYQEKLLPEFNEAELSHFEWSENVHDIYQRIKISFFEDNMEYLTKHTTLATNPTLKMWGELAKQFRTLYSEEGMTGLTEGYYKVSGIDKTVVKMS